MPGRNHLLEPSSSSGRPKRRRLIAKQLTDEECEQFQGETFRDNTGREWTMEDLMFKEEEEEGFGTREDPRGVPVYIITNEGSDVLAGSSLLDSNLRLRAGYSALHPTACATARTDRLPLQLTPLALDPGPSTSTAPSHWQFLGETQPEAEDLSGKEECDSCEIVEREIEVIEVSEEEDLKGDDVKKDLAADKRKREYVEEGGSENEKKKKIRSPEKDKKSFDSEED